MKKYELPVVTEFCSQCMREIELRWDPKADGFKAYCPHCGGRLMLCDACLHADEYGLERGQCDYDSDNDTCRHNQQSKKYVLLDDALNAVCAECSGGEHCDKTTCGHTKFLRDLV